MSRHHNTEHPERSTSNYKTRAGMMGTTGHLAAIEGNQGLRARQERRIANFGSPFPRGEESEVDE